MKVNDLFGFSISNLRRNKMRTLLTVSGVVIGIGAIVFLISLGFGLQNLVLQKIVSMDSLTTVEVQPKKAKLTKTSLTQLGSIQGVKYASPSYQVSAQALLDKKKSDLSVFAINPKYLKIEGVNIDSGDGFPRENQKSIILSRAALKGLGIKEASTLIGKKVQLLIYVKKGNKLILPDNPGQKPLLTVVGISRETKNSEGFVPLSLIEKLESGNYYSIKVKASKREAVGKIKKQISGMDFAAVADKDPTADIEAIFRWVKIILGGFGMIALFVASIGIFNTMTISLLERTHEIGIMKSIGAKNKDVRRMFIFEAAQIGFWGGLLGLFGGWSLGVAINAVVNLLAKKYQGPLGQQIFNIPLWFSLTVVIFALFVSLFAGIYPARRAGKLNPIEAMRNE